MHLAWWKLRIPLLLSNGVRNILETFVTSSRPWKLHSTSNKVMFDASCGEVEHEV